MLLVFGGRTHVKDIKNKVNGEQKIAKQNLNERHITASPLDYHMFRQEIISKYPAFNPPTPIFPFEPENTSIVPPLHEAVTRDDGAGPANVHDQSSSIIHQPVHIATPAPSPPPSPAGPGGKGVKKQNYQTNQMFPFLYPPLEDPSNASEGKDNAGLQNIALDKKWNGSDIPTSIREAADLFAERMRATRSMKQLWEEREKFLKYERGYESFDSYTRSKPEPQSRIASDEFSDSFGFSALSHDEQRRLLNVDRYYVRVNLYKLYMILTDSIAGRAATKAPVCGHCASQGPLADSDDAGHAAEYRGWFAKWIALWQSKRQSEWQWTGSERSEEAGKRAPHEPRSCAIARDHGQSCFWNTFDIAQMVQGLT